jgi:hypothetical protein
VGKRERRQWGKEREMIERGDREEHTSHMNQLIREREALSS